MQIKSSIIGKLITDYQELKRAEKVLLFLVGQNRQGWLFVNGFKLAVAGARERELLTHLTRERILTWRA